MWKSVRLTESRCAGSFTQTVSTVSALLSGTPASPCHLAHTDAYLVCFYRDCLRPQQVSVWFKRPESNPQFFFTNVFSSYLNSCKVGGLFVSFTSGIACTGRVRLQVSPPSSPSSLLQTTWMSTTTKVWDTQAQVHTHAHTHSCTESCKTVCQTWAKSEEEQTLTTVEELDRHKQLDYTHLEHSEHCMNNMMLS